MPITQQARKWMRQSKVRATRNQHYNHQMKSMIRLLMGYVKAGEVEKAKKVLPQVVSLIDTCAKKNIIHRKNAGHKKSLVQRSINKAPEKKVEKPVVKKEKK